MQRLKNFLVFCVPFIWPTVKVVGFIGGVLFWVGTISVLARNGHNGLALAQVVITFLGLVGMILWQKFLAHEREVAAQVVKKMLYDEMEAKYAGMVATKQAGAQQIKSSGQILGRISP